jgi:two-component system, NtrC family, response regulator AtoC
MDKQGRSRPMTTMASGGDVPTSGRVLLVVGDNHFGTYPLPPGSSVVIGRDASCDVPLPHPKISRRHTLIRSGDTLEVEDLGSTNGTRVAGHKLDKGKRMVLDVGSNLRVGPYVVVVLEATGEPSVEAPLRAALPISDPTAAGVREVVARLAQAMVSVLITGETGVGKEVLARTIHELSGRQGQFVAINCASLSESLLESELFGHERGAFTGAAATKPGLFEVADGGTVFLDEIGELPPSLQAKLLRVLETRTVYRVGGVKPVSLDVRFLAATHRTLLDEVARGAFRQDLYFRVNGIMLTVLPLRERRESIPRLASTFLASAMPAGRKPPRIAAAAMAALVAHDWPGNVRELRTVMERAAVLCEGEELRPAHLLLDAAVEQRPAPEAAPAPAPASGGSERQRIVDALEACAGNQTRAARMLGISRTTLVQKLAIHGIPRPRTPAR